MKKLLAIFLAVAMILACSLTSFAAADYLKISAVEDADGIVTFTVTGTGTGFYGIFVRLSTSGLTYVDGSLVLEDKFTQYKNANSVEEFAADSIKLQYDDFTKKIDLNDDKIMSFKCTAAADWSVDFLGKTGAKKTIFYTNTEYSSKDHADVVTIATTPYEGGSTAVKEEEFVTPVTVATPEQKDFNYDGSNVTIGEGATQIAVFGKNPSAGLKAYYYGITVNGIEFPGIADVGAGQYWCIKLVAPNGVDADGDKFIGNYTVDSYVITETGTLNGGAVSVNVQ